MPNLTTAKPFIKWAGGKVQLLPEIVKRLPHEILSKADCTYVEPFVGGGAVLFYLLQNYPHIKKAIINDINPHLVTTYRVVKTQTTSLIKTLAHLESEYLPKEEMQRADYYLQQRERFNSSAPDDVERAALFIFLNRTCFNGLYSVNKKGIFNVPHGRYKHPCICNSSLLSSCAKLLQRTEILCGDFSETACYAAPSTVFYLDPPYKPISPTASFTAYAQDGFDDSEQVRLNKFCEKISRKQARFLLSNSDPIPQEKENGYFDMLYNQFEIHRISAQRIISCKAETRSCVSELLIRN